MFYESFQQMKKQLGQVEKWLEMATAYAEQKKFDPNLYLGFRLAPDQLPLSAQVGIACDTAKLGAARLTGKEAPAHADNQTTVAELHARLQSVQQWLGAFTAKDFEGAATRTITTPRWEGKTMTGQDFFLEHVQPNFGFHVAHTYALLRHNGVPVGKKDYLGTLTQTAPKT